jgi:hypothetical protein
LKVAEQICDSSIHATEENPAPDACDLFSGSSDMVHVYGTFQFSTYECPQAATPATWSMDRDREHEVSLDGLWRFHLGDDPNDAAVCSKLTNGTPLLEGSSSVLVSLWASWK